MGADLTVPENWFWAKMSGMPPNLSDSIPGFNQHRENDDKPLDFRGAGFLWTKHDKAKWEVQRERERESYAKQSTPLESVKVLVVLQHCMT